jgi:molecular chaperone GrpE (heat shock protein)
MTTLEQYNVTLIDQLNVVFDPMMHDPVERIPVGTQEQHDTVVKVVQKGYQSGNVVLRPAKVNVGNYEN